MERFYPNFYSYTKSHYEPLTPQSLCRSESVSTGLSQRTVGRTVCDLRSESNRLTCSSTEHVHRVGQHPPVLCESLVPRKRMLSGGVGGCGGAGCSGNSVGARSDKPKGQQDKRNQISDVDTDSERWMREQSDPPGMAICSTYERSGHSSGKGTNSLVSTTIAWPSLCPREKLQPIGVSQPNMLVIPRSVPLYPTLPETTVCLKTPSTSRSSSVKAKRQVSFRQPRSPVLLSTVEDELMRPSAHVRPQGALGNSLQSGARIKSGTGGQLIKSELLKSSASDKSKRVGLRLDKPVRKTSSAKSTRSPSPCVMNKLPVVSHAINTESSCRMKPRATNVHCTSATTSNRLIEAERAVREELAAEKKRGVSPISPSVLDSLVPPKATTINSSVPIATSCTDLCCAPNLNGSSSDILQVPTSHAVVRHRRREENAHGTNPTSYQTSAGTPNTLTTSCTPCAIVHPLQALTHDMGHPMGQSCTGALPKLPIVNSSSATFVDLKPCPSLTVSLCDTRMGCAEHEARLNAETGENLERLADRVKQLTTLNTMKDSEIRELRSTVNQLRSDITKIQSNQLTPTGMQPRPPRSTSCRTIPDNSRQHGSQETLSLNSLASGASSGGPESATTRIQCSASDALTRHSPSPTSDGERTPGKRSRWIRPGLGRAFKKRSKSHMNANDRSTTPTEPYHRDSGPTATVCNNPGIARNLLPPSSDQFLHHVTSLPNADMNDQSAQSLLMQMRWELDYLEADNQRLRRLILNAPSLIDPPSTAQANQQTVITLTDLSTRYCVKGDRVLHVYAELEPSPLRNAFQKLQSSTELSASPKIARTESSNIKLMKMGCIGLSSLETGGPDGWNELDTKIEHILTDYMKYLAPTQQLVDTEPLIRAYTLQCNRYSGTEMPKLVRCRLFDETSGMTFAPTMQFQPNCSPTAWIEQFNQTDLMDCEVTWFVIVHLDGSSTAFTAESNPTGTKQSRCPPNELVQLNLLSFETLIPVGLLKDYVRQMREHRLVVLCGPTGTRKTRILHKVAELLVQDSKQPNSIRSFYVKPNGSTMVKELHCFIAQHLATFHRHGIPQVMILENLHHIQGSLVEMLDALNKNYPTPWPVILATSDLLTDQLKVLETRFSVHFIEHLTDIDSTASYLNSYLRRKLAQVRLFLPKSNVDQSKYPASGVQNDDVTLTQLVNWIPKVWKHLNQLSNAQHQHTCPAIFGLRIFLACPIDVAASKHWFTDLWNNLFIPFLFKTRSTEESTNTSNSRTTSLNDSFDWIMATWPWPRDKSDVLATTNKDGNDVSKFGDQIWALPPASPTPSSQKHNSFGSNRTALTQNRTSQDSGIMSDGYLNLYGVNVDKRSSRGSDSGDRLSTNPTERCLTPCTVSPSSIANGSVHTNLGYTTPDPNESKSPYLTKRKQMPVSVGGTNQDA